MRRTPRKDFIALCGAFHPARVGRRHYTTVCADATRNDEEPPSSNSCGYSFPIHRLQELVDSHKTPAVLIACGSFNPVTYLHLRMFEMAKDYVRQNTDFEVVGSYLSPVCDGYNKAGLLSAQHRVAMCTLAAERTTELMVDSWETFQAYQLTAGVLDHFDRQINTVLGGVRPDEERRKARVMLLAGSDLVATMSEPGVWSDEDLDHILGRYGCFIVDRSGTDSHQAIQCLTRWRHNIHLVPQLIQNDVSSTKVRLSIRRGLSVRYLVPAQVVDYIEQHGLYREDDAKEKGSG
ncbi:Nucleotidylyl transferase [Hymenopellis radicata]|nr:Nucleotidylyl transferase [Hymenopellis radicata]